MPFIAILQNTTRGGSGTAGGGATPQIALDLSSLSFTATAGGASPDAQVVTITNGGTGTLNTPTVGSTVDPDSIITSAVITGTGPWSLTVTLATGALTAGTYNATVPVESTNANNSPQIVSVEFVVAAADAYTWTAGATDNGAALPSSKVDTAINWAAQTGTVHTVTSAAEFATALTNQASQDNPVIKVTANIDLTSSLTLPNRTGAGFCYIVTDYEYNRSQAGSPAFAKAPGQRATSADTATMRRLRTTAANTPIFRALTQASPAHHYRIIGFEMTATATQQSGLIQLGSSSSATQANFPSYIIVDRCYLYGNPGTTNMRRGVDMNGQHTAVIDSTLVQFYDSGATESQAILLRWSAGPYKVVNNDLSAAGECIMSGGDSTSIRPSDLEFRYNYVHANPAWEGVYSVKNLLELKFIDRALIEGNDFRYMWVSGQSGHAIHIKSTSQSGTGPGAQYKTNDVVVRWNRFRDYQEPFRVIGATEDSNQSTDNLVMHDNLWVEKRAGNGAFWMEAAVNAGPINGLVLKNNVIDAQNGSYSSYCNTPSRTKGDSFTFTDNVIRTGTGSAGPLWCDSTPNTANALAAIWTAYSYTLNACYGQWTTGTTGSNTVSATGTWNGIYTDQAAGDYTIAVGHAFKGVGTGGADPGPGASIYDRLQYSIGGQRPGEV